MTYEEAVAYAKWYSRMLRDLKRAGLKVADMPDDVAQAHLALHQRALVAQAVIRKYKKQQHW